MGWGVGFIRLSVAPLFLWRVVLFSLLFFVNNATAQSVPQWSYTGPDSATIRDLLLRPDGVLFAATNVGLYTSIDDGATWDALKGPLQMQAVRSISQLPNDDTTLIAALSRSVYVSRDGGNAWRQGGSLPRVDESGFSPLIFDTTTFAALPDHLFVLTDSGVFASTDAGATFVLFGLEGMWVDALAVDSKNPLRMLAGVRNARNATPSSGGVFETADGGASWRPLVQQLDLLGRSSDIQFVDSIIYLESSNLWIAAVSGGTMFSDDGGATWRRSTSEFTNVTALTVLNGRVYGVDGRKGLVVLDVATVAWQGVGELNGLVWAIGVSETGALIAGGSGGIAISSDGGATWLKSSSGMRGANVLRLIQSTATGSTIYAVSPNNNAYRFEKRTETWVPLFPSYSSGASGVKDLAVDPNDSAHLLVGGWQALSSRDGGGSWISGKFTLAPGIVVTDVGLGDIAVDPNNSTTKYATSGMQVFITRDDGATWFSALELPIDSRESLEFIEVGGTRPTTIYTLGNRGVRRSNDAGETWSEPVQVSRIPGSLDLRIDPFDANTIYVLTGTLKVSRDGGQTWVETGREMGLVSELAFDTRTPNVVYAVAPNVGIMVSNDGALTWQRATALGVPPVGVIAMTLDIASGDVFAASSMNGIWRCHSCIGGASSDLPSDNGGDNSQRSPIDTGATSPPSDTGTAGGGFVSVWVLLTVLSHLFFRTCRPSTRVDLISTS